jgi:hypothetical protein
VGRFGSQQCSQRREQQGGEEGEGLFHGLSSYFVVDEISPIFAPPLSEIGFGTSVVMMLN